MSTAFFTLTMLENPRHLLRSLRFMVDAISRKRRLRHDGRGTLLFDVSAPRWRVYAAMLVGPFIYLQMCIRHPFQNRYSQVRRDGVAQTHAPEESTLRERNGHPLLPKQ